MVIWQSMMILSSHNATGIQILISPLPRLPQA